MIILLDKGKNKHDTVKITYLIYYICSYVIEDYSHQNKLLIMIYSYEH